VCNPGTRISEVSSIDEVVVKFVLIVLMAAEECDGLVGVGMASWSKS